MLFWNFSHSSAIGSLYSTFLALASNLGSSKNPSGRLFLLPVLLHSTLESGLRVWLTMYWAARNVHWKEHQIALGCMVLLEKAYWTMCNTYFCWHSTCQLHWKTADRSPHQNQYHIVLIAQVFGLPPGKFSAIGCICVQWIASHLSL